MSLRSSLWAAVLGLCVAADAGADEGSFNAPKPPAAGLQLPASLRDDLEPQAADPDDADDDRRRSGRTGFSIGPMGGYLKARDADRGTWFAGIQARLRFLEVLAVEGSIGVHQNEYSDGDVVVTQYPVQVSALFLPFPGGALDPYVLAGGGWYYQRIDYDDSIGGGDETDRMFGGHVGAGAIFHLSPTVSAFADVRWVFLDEPGTDNSDLLDEDFDYCNVTFGVSFGF